MAFKDNSIQFNQGYSGEVFREGFYNLNQAVGGPDYGSNMPAANLVTDMQLIFYFDFIIYRDGDKNIFPGSPRDKFTVTPSQYNYYSEHTRDISFRMIWQFQTDLKNRGKPIFQDGRCDPARGKISGYSKTPYTIMMYNFYYAHTVKIAYNRTDWQNYLMQDPLLPEEVRYEIWFSKEAYQWL